MSLFWPGRSWALLRGMRARIVHSFRSAELPSSCLLQGWSVVMGFRGFQKSFPAPKKKASIKIWCHAVVLPSESLKSRARVVILCIAFPIKFAMTYSSMDSKLESKIVHYVWNGKNIFKITWAFSDVQKLHIWCCIVVKFKSKQIKARSRKHFQTRSAETANMFMWFV